MISRETIDGLAKLARLDLSEEEKEALRKDVSNILQYVDAVSSVEVVGDANKRGSGLSGGVPIHHNVMREDTPRAADDQLAGKEEAIRAQFPKRSAQAGENDYNVVRKIIQKEE